MIVLTINPSTFVMTVIAAVISGCSYLLSATLDNFGDAMTYALGLTVVGTSSAAKGRAPLYKRLMLLGIALAMGMLLNRRERRDRRDCC